MTKGKEEANRIISGYKRPVFTDRKGMKEVKQEGIRHKEGHKPEQPERHGDGVMTEAGTESGDSKDVNNLGRFSFNPSRIFKAAEVTADPDKIQHIGQEGRRGSIEDV